MSDPPAINFGLGEQTMPVDWNATGTMLTGWGTLAGAAAIAYAAKVGANTFGSWKRQKQEERRMDAAERILTLAYRLRYDLEAIRSPGLFHYELESAGEQLRAELKNFDLKPKGEQDRIRTAQVYKNRMDRHEGDFQEVWTTKPVALALFGPSVEKGLHEFWRNFMLVGMSSTALSEDDGNDKDFSRSIRRDLSTSSKDTAITLAIEAAIRALECELLPVIRSGYDPGKQ